MFQPAFSLPRQLWTYQSDLQGMIEIQWCYQNKVLHFSKQGIVQCLCSLQDNLCFHIIRTGSRIKCPCQNPVHFTINILTTKSACKISTKKPKVDYLIKYLQSWQFHTTQWQKGNNKIIKLCYDMQQLNTYN